MASGARIAVERAAGWHRQLRITPLSSRAYFRTKVLTGYVMGCLTIAVLYIAGSVLGVRLSVAHWVEMTLFILLGLVPFAALGILLGHLLNPDSIGPAMGGTTALLSILGGVWFPITSGALHDIAQLLPSFWLVQASHIALGGSGWGWLGWVVMTGWTIVFTALAVRAYRRDTAR
jgi:ABC-2 type transport system permease protein